MNASISPTTSSGTVPEISRAITIPADELKRLKPHVITLTDGRLDRKQTPNPKSIGDFTTVEADIDAIFKTHLPAFIKKQGGGTVPIVLYAHGGLVTAQDGFAIANRQVTWWKENGVYPIQFVWKSGLFSAIADAIKYRKSRDLLGLGEAKDRALEAAARVFGGDKVWLDMKLDAAASSSDDGGARIFVQKLAAWMQKNPQSIEVHAVGHSAGSIFHSHLIPVALDEGVPLFHTVSFLAPAVRVDTFKTMLLPRKEKIQKLAVFTMTDEQERKDTCFKYYGKSLLYLVSASFEPAGGTPILGLQKSIYGDPEVRDFLDGPGGEVIYSPNKSALPKFSNATTHGGFDDDPPTMDSVLVRITGLSKPAVPFVSDSFSRARQLEFDPSPEPDPTLYSSRSAVKPRGGAKTALCIGIDAYQRNDQLMGAVNDAEQWCDALKQAGFEVDLLTDNDATRDAILGSIFTMVTNSTAGDTLVVQYAGHGTFVPDPSGEEEDNQDEAICPVDFREGNLILDDDLAPLWDLIPDDVSLTIFFDSCHSGGANRMVEYGDSESISRGVQLTDTDKQKFFVARGLAAPAGKEQALKNVLGSETAVLNSFEVTSRHSEVLFAACKATQLAWETKGQGDFTKFVVPLIADNIGRASNQEFFNTITNGFGSSRQEPSFVAVERRGGAPLLAAAFVNERPPEATITANVDRESTSGRRDAAIATILRGIADLLES